MPVNEHRTSKRPRVAILVNIIAPYRIPLYEAIGRVFETRVFVAGEEANRSTWRSAVSKITSVTVKKSWGVTIPYGRGRSDGTYDNRYLHITPGYLLDLLRFRPHAVVSNEMGFRSHVALLYGALFRRPVWIWWGGTVHTSRIHAGRLRQAAHSVVARWAPHWISYGETSTEYLTTIGVPMRRVLQVQNCIDERPFRQGNKRLLQLDPKPVLLCVGQLVGLKGLDRLIRALALLQNRGRKFTVLFVGDGPEKEPLRKAVGKLGLRNVHFHSGVPYEDMPGLYRSADALVFPTLDDVWGLVVNEALWSGLPVLCSTYAGCARELLPPENVFDPLDEGDMLRALERTLDGRIAPADLSRLMSCADVANLLVSDIRRVLSRQALFRHAGETPG